MLRASNTVAASGSAGDVGWRKLKERREKMMVMFSKRLEVLEEG